MARQGEGVSRKHDRFLGFVFGRCSTVFMDASLLLLAPDAASAFAATLRAEEAAKQASISGTAPQGGEQRIGGGAQVSHAGEREPGSLTGTPDGGSQTGAPSPPKRRFYGSIDLDPTLAKRQFADIVDEVVQQFTAKLGVRVRISIELEAQSPSPFDDGLQRVVKENRGTLKFKAADFEDTD